MNFSWFTIFSAMVLTSHCYLNLVSSEANQTDPNIIPSRDNSVARVGTARDGTIPEADFGPGTCKKPEDPKWPWRWNGLYCGEDNVFHGATGRLFGRCWKQCEVGGSTWCWTGRWTFGFLLTFNMCRMSDSKGRRYYNDELGKCCYGKKERFCRSVCFPESLGKNE